MSTFFTIGHMNQLADALEAAGYSREDVTRLRTGIPLLRRLKDVFEGSAVIVSARYYGVDCDAEPFVPEGWRVEKHVKGGFLDAESIQVALSLPAGEVPYNANLLDYLLAHPELVPEKWEHSAVIFTGTIYHWLGASCVRYLNGGANWTFMKF